MTMASSVGIGLQAAVLLKTGGEIGVGDGGLRMHPLGEEIRRPGLQLGRTSHAVTIR